MPTVLLYHVLNDQFVLTVVTVEFVVTAVVFVMVSCAVPETLLSAPANGPTNFTLNVSLVTAEAPLNCQMLVIPPPLLEDVLFTVTFVPLSTNVTLAPGSNDL